MMNFPSKTMNLLIEKDELCIENDEFQLKMMFSFKVCPAPSRVNVRFSTDFRLFSPFFDCFCYKNDDCVNNVPTPAI